MNQINATQTTCTETSQFGRRLDFIVPTEIVNHTFKKVFDSLQKFLQQHENKNFSLEEIKNKHFKIVIANVTEELIAVAYTNALSLYKLNPVAHPEINHQEPQENQPFEFSAEIELRPVVKLQKIEGIVLNKAAGASPIEIKTLLFKELVRLNPVEAPQSLVLRQKEFLEADLEQQMLEQGLKPKKINELIKSSNHDLLVSANETIQRHLLVEEIAEMKKLFANNIEVEAKINEISVNSKADFQSLLHYYLNDPARSHQIRYLVTEEKVAKFLLEKALILEN